jgi:hypothetical protein
VGYGVLQRHGDAIDVDDDEALRLIEAKQAEFIETAMDEPRVECAVLSRKRTSRRP